MQEASIADQIARLAPRNAYPYGLGSIVISAPIPSDHNQFVIATPPTAWSRGIQAGIYRVELFDVSEQELV